MDSSFEGLISLCCLSLCCMVVLGGIMSAAFVRRMTSMVGNAQRAQRRRFKSTTYGRGRGRDNDDDSPLGSLADLADRFLK